MRGGPLQIVADTLRTTTKTGKLCSANLSPSPTIRLEGRGRLSERPVRNATDIECRKILCRAPIGESRDTGPRDQGSKAAMEGRHGAESFRFFPYRRQRGPSTGPTGARAARSWRRTAWCCVLDGKNGTESARRAVRSEIGTLKGWRWRPARNMAPHFSFRVQGLVGTTGRRIGSGASTFLARRRPKRWRWNRAQ